MFELEDVPKDEVNLTVFIAFFAPTLHDILIITLDTESMQTSVRDKERMDKQLEAGCFCPSDFTVIDLPAQKETLDMSTSLNDDGHINSKAGIRVY